MRKPRTDELAVSRAVGANVAALRKMRGWSQRALANQTQNTGKAVGFSTICRMEKAARPDQGPVAVYVDDVVSLAAAFGVTVQRLITPPKCRACMDQPPPGFACRACGASA
ncbi:helix-turn-helix transcriptional regulator [Streptomyces sp. NPDC048304]|uniref:helix-turn-helix domain-containing protein n=1 Tax=Streptomyces sp. NPDC048304 TaxID=3154820 RepID=UPI00340AB962